MALDVFLVLLILTSFGGNYYVIRKQNKELVGLRRRVARIAAADDNEVIAVLEASSTPLSQKLLAVVNAPPEPPAPHKIEDGLSSENVCRFAHDFSLEAMDNNRLDVLEDWLLNGHYFSDDQKSTVVSSFAMSPARSKARALFTKHNEDNRQKLRRKGKRKPHD